MRRRAALHRRSSASSRSWWRQLALLLVGFFVSAGSTTTTSAAITTTTTSTTHSITTTITHTTTSAVSVAAAPGGEKYQNLHSVIGATDLSMFRKMGGGECLAPASRPVRGRARRDFSHLLCRLLCVEHCLGYSYAPCERVCTLHGNPEKLANTSDEDGWGTVNGGGKIVGSTNQCGTSCYQRMAPCKSGEVVSNTAVLNASAMAFGGTTLASCPIPFVGMLSLRCGLYGAYVEAGRCRSPCAPGVVVNGNFDVHYPMFLHGAQTSATCPSGATGTIWLSCTDGKATWERGRCGYDCVLGSLIAGDAVLSYPPLAHEAEIKMTCPSTNVTSTSGNVTLRCWDSLVNVKEGTCSLNCDGGELPLRYGETTGAIVFGAFNHSEENETDCEPDTNFTGKVTLRCHRGKVSIIDGVCRRHCLPSAIGPGVKAVPFPRFDHETELKIQCLPGFIGELSLKCEDSNVTIKEGVCMMHCLPGSITTNGIALPHVGFNHSSSVNLTCPWPSHYGFVVASCDDGAVSYTGGCGNNCAAGWHPSHGALVKWDFIRHDVTHNITCPEPWVGWVTIRCYDGSYRYMEGWCGRPCKAGGVSKNGAVVYYGALNHTDVRHFECNSLFATGLSFSGGVTVQCNDGLTDSDGSCEADCPDGKMPKDGSQVFYPKMSHGTSTTAVCSPGTVNNPTYGTVQVLCTSGYAEIISGSCGAPCPAGEFAGPQTRDDYVTHPTISNLDAKWVTCPPHLSGYIKLSCDNGMISVAGEGSCGERCAEANHKLYGSSFRSPMMEHGGRLDVPCTAPFNGVVKLACDFGYLNATSACQAECLPGTVTLDYGAVVHYPIMMSGDLFYTNCPQGFVDVPVVIRCHDGKGVIHSGGCFKHCLADWFWQPDCPVNLNGKKSTDCWTLQHFEIQHTRTSSQDCPEYFDGRVTLSCFNGKPTMIGGHCSKNCRPGRMRIRPGVIVTNREMTTGFLAAQIPCPASFDGNMRLLCTEGEVTLGEGGCNATCSPAVVNTAPHGEIGDSEVAEIACPDTGTLKLRCNDGITTLLGGSCFKGCEAGTVIDANGTRIEYPYIRHGESLAGVCSGLAKGVVTVACNDTKVVAVPLPGEQCLRFCRTKAVKTPGGAIIFPKDTAHGNQDTVRCPNGQLGLVTVTCYDTEFIVLDGECGDVNCPESYVDSNGAYLSHFAINNGWEAGPTQCPAPYEGIATFRCRNGTTVVDEVTDLLPVSPDDYEAVAIGNESSEDSRFVLCECCHPLGRPPGAAPVEGRDTGIFIWAAAVAGGFMIVVAAFSGWYFLPRKKTSRVWPERVKPPNPRPIHEQGFERILDQFQLKLKNSPELVDAVMEKSKLKALPLAEQRKAIENMKRDPQASKMFFSRRTLNYLLAVEDALTSPQPTSPKSVSTIRSNKPGGLPPQLSIFDSPQDDLRSPGSSLQMISPGNTQAALAWQESPDVSPIPITDGPEFLPQTGELRQLTNAPSSELGPRSLRDAPPEQAPVPGVVHPS